ncbi:MAG: hypothetical protein AAHH96_05900 [Candidatus Symbiodolus clandestinus]
MTEVSRSMSSNSLHPSSGLSEATKAIKLPRTSRSLSVVENDKPSLSRNSSIKELHREEIQGFQPIVSEDASLSLTDEEQVKSFKFNEDELRETLNSLCNDDHPVLEFLQTAGKTKKQQIDEYKQLKKDINNGIKFHSEIPGMPDIETLKTQKKLITQAAIAAGIEKPKLDIVKKFFSNKDNILALGVALSGLAVSLPTLITGIVASENTIDEGVEETEETTETKQEIAANEQEINQLEKQLDPKGKQEEIESLKRDSAEYKEQEALSKNPENFNKEIVNGNIIGEDLKPEAKDKIQQAGDHAVTEHRNEQKDIQTKINDLKSKNDTLQDKLATQTANAPHQSTNSIDSGAVIGVGTAMLAGSLILGGTIKYRLKRKDKSNLDISDADKNRLEEKKQKNLEEQKKIKENLKEITAEEKRLKQEVKEQAKLSQREENSKNAQNMYSISKQEYEASKSIPEDSSITEGPNSSKTEISDQPTSDKSTSKESDVTKN